LVPFQTMLTRPLNTGASARKTAGPAAKASGDVRIARRHLPSLQEIGSGGSSAGKAVASPAMAQAASFQK